MHSPFTEKNFLFAICSQKKRNIDLDKNRFRKSICASMILF